MPVTSVFISYRRNTGADLAALISDRLVARDVNVFRDVEGLKPGEDWRNRIDAEIDAADAIIVLWTGDCFTPRADTMEDDQFLREIVRAKEQNKPIVVVRKDSATDPSDPLPEAVSQVYRQHAIEWNHSYEREVLNQIIESVIPTDGYRPGPGWLKVPVIRHHDRAVYGRGPVDAVLLNELSQRTSGVVEIVAPPGFGKTTYMMHILRDMKQDVPISAYWFIVGERTSDIIASLAHQFAKSSGLAFSVAEIAHEELETREAALARVIRAYSRNWSTTPAHDRKAAYILIDSLHEADRPDILINSIKPLWDLPGIVWIVSCRPITAIRREFPRDGSCFVIDLHDEKTTNAAEGLKELLQNAGTGHRSSLSAEQIKEIITAANGNFAMMKHFADNFARSTDPNIAERVAQLRGFEAYADLICQEEINHAVAAGVPDDCARITLALYALSSRPMSLQTLQLYCKEAAEACRLSSDAADAQMADEIEAVLEHLGVVTDLENGSLLEKSDNTADDELTYFHPFVGEVLLSKLSGTHRHNLEVAHYVLRTGPRRFITALITDAETAADFTEIVEGNNSVYFSDWIRSSSRSDIDNCLTALLAWYLYGHYWWDEYTPTFQMCTELLEILKYLSGTESYLQPASVNQCHKYLVALQNLREHWSTLPSLWRRIRVVDAGALEASKALWKEASNCLERVARLVTPAGVDRNGKPRRAPQFEIEYGIIDSVIATSRAEALHGIGNYVKSEQTYIESNRVMDECPALAWGVMYNSLDIADLHLATDRLPEVPALLLDALQRNIDVEDVEVDSTVMRACGDMLWSNGRLAEATRAYNAAIYFGLLAPEIAGSVDGYYYLYADEMNWSLMDRLRTLYARAPQDAVNLAISSAAFWQPYLSRIYPGYSVPSSTAINELLALSADQVASLCDIALPAGCKLLCDQSAPGEKVRILPEVPALNSPVRYIQLLREMMEDAAFEQRDEFVTAVQDGTITT